MNLLKVSKQISYYLRHNHKDMPMTKGGYVKTKDLIELVRKECKGAKDFTLENLLEIIKQEKEKTSKQRYSFKDYTMEEIKANYGHSLNIDMMYEEYAPKQKYGLNNI